MLPVYQRLNIKWSVVNAKNIFLYSKYTEQKL